MKYAPLFSEGDLFQLTGVRAEIYGAVALKFIETAVREQNPFGVPRLRPFIPQS